MRRTLGALVVVMSLAFMACDDGTASDGGTSGGTTGGSGGTTGGGSDPTSACVGYCAHVLECSGVSNSQATSACQSSCSDISSQTGGASCTNVTGFFNCLAGVPCSVYLGGLDGGLTTSISDCASANGCH